MFWIMLNDLFWKERFTTVQAISISFISGIIISGILFVIAYFLL